jgi:hypothetical protein
MDEEGFGYEKWERDWTVKTCPKCKGKLATAHGWGFQNPPPPRNKAVDDRKPIEEVWLHEDGTECRTSSATEI